MNNKKLGWCFKLKDGLKIVEPNERLSKSYVKNENCILQDVVVTWCVFILEHPKNNGLYKPHLLRCGAPLFF